MGRERTFLWGGIRIPLQEANKHFFVMGATGSGKTITIRLLMQEVLPSIGEREDRLLLDHRALIYDAKQDMLGYLYGMGIDPKRIKVLNPFDQRASAWDMSTDITSPAAAQQVATILIPHEKNASQPFFGNAARHLLYGVLLAFIAKKKKSGYCWTFRDVVLAMRSEEHMRRLFIHEECRKHTEHLVDMYLHEGETFNSIKSTIATKMMPYEIVAAAWSKAAEERPMISLKHFLDPKKERQILLLGSDEANREAVNAINRVLFKRLSELVIAEADSDERRTWIILDEVREAGELDGLQSLLLRGRSKGACVVLGFQDIDGLRDLYGEHRSQELVGQCAFKAILRLESPTTAEWASRHFGTEERVVERGTDSSTFGQGTQRQVGKNQQLEKREIVLPIALLKIAPVSWKHRQLSGYYLTPLQHFANTFRFGEAEIDPDPRHELRYFPLGKRVRGIEVLLRDEEHQYLEPWSPAELEQILGDGSAGPESPDESQSGGGIATGSEAKSLRTIEHWNLRTGTREQREIPLDQ